MKDNCEHVKKLRTYSQGVTEAVYDDVDCAMRKRKMKQASKKVYDIYRLTRILPFL